MSSSVKLIYCYLLSQPLFIHFLTCCVLLRQHSSVFCPSNYVPLTCIVFSVFFWSTKNVKSVSDSLGNRCAILTQERGFNYAWADYYVEQNTNLRGCYLQVTWWDLSQWKGRETTNKLLSSSLTFPTSCTISDKSSSSCKISFTWQITKSRYSRYIFPFVAT